MTTTSTIRREAVALQRIKDALETGLEGSLSNVFCDSYDCAHDGAPHDHGFDSDDLAAVLFPILTEHFA